MSGASQIRCPVGSASTQRILFEVGFDKTPLAQHHPSKCPQQPPLSIVKASSDLARQPARDPSAPESRAASVWGTVILPIAGRVDHCGLASSRAANTSLWGKVSIVLRFVPRRAMSNINSRPAPPVRAYTPGPPDTSNNFLTEQISKQQKNNFHSSSLTAGVVNMVANSVNKTALHPSGVA